MPTLQSYIRALKYLWASPVIAVGLLAALVSMMFGEPMHWRDGALIVHADGPLGRRLKARGWGGFTLGITVFLWSWEDPRIEYHERIHVRQVLTWGPLFPLIYFASLAIHGYRKNVFESEAYRETDEWHVRR